MSLMLFPPERSNENLAYLILPLGIALLLTTIFNPNLTDMNWISAVLLGASIGALFLYVIAPVDILLRKHFRSRANDTWGERLDDSLSKWHEELFLTQLIEKQRRRTRENMVSNAIASYSIRRRCLRIRVLVYFMLAYWPYVLSVQITTYRIEGVNELIKLAFLVSSSALALLVFAGLFYLYKGRRVYGSHLLRDIAYVAEFTFATLTLKRCQAHPKCSQANDAISGDLVYLDILLVRQDLDTFAILWGNTWSKLVKLKSA